MTIRIIDRPKEKFCTKCGALKPLSEFDRDASRKDGRACWCKKCKMNYNKRYAQSEKSKAAHKRYYENHREAALQRARKYAQSKKGKAVHAAASKRYEQSEKGKAVRSAAHARRRARLEGAEGDVSPLEIFKLLHEAKACAYCGRTGVELTIEHIVPLSRGGSHAIDNLLPVCKRCNSSKGDRLLGEWLPWDWFGAPPEGDRSKLPCHTN